jgi:hypothetical protein
MNEEKSFEMKFTLRSPQAKFSSRDAQTTRGEKKKSDFSFGSVASKTNEAREFFKQNDFNDTEIKLLYMPHNIQPDKILNIHASRIALFLLLSALSPSPPPQTSISSIKSRAKFA